MHALKLVPLMLCAAGLLVTAQQPLPVSNLPDISGIAWMEGDTFLSVHDSKNDDQERGRTRVSVLTLPAAFSSPRGVGQQPSLSFRPLKVVWPSDEPHDLESIARIPNTPQVLLVESGDDASASKRIFLAALRTAEQLTIDEVVPWPVPIHNVEASAVFTLGAQLYFAYAERADGLSRTEIRWARMHLNPLRFERFSSAKYAARLKGPGVRPVVALDIDAAGRVFAATAYDPGNDNGPFRSVVSCIGQFRSGSGGKSRFVPAAASQAVAIQNGYKVAGVAIRPRQDGRIEIYAGTDDENFGASFRQVLLPSVPATATPLR
jgi:hypothetical protein